MNTQSSVSYRQKLENRSHWGIKCGLSNIQRLLKNLNNPHHKIKTLLIAGTNGKGSTGAFIANALVRCGIKVGWTTSPHLISPTERIWINGSNIKPNYLESLLFNVFQAEEKEHICATYFEIITAAAFQAFEEENVDIAIVEVGMGGRWDATNISDPILTILTNVEIDHVAYLGNTREQIACEKLCTSRSGRPLIIGPTIDINWIKPLLTCDPLIFSTPRIKADVIAIDHTIVGNHKIQLAGKHQIDNLSIALETIKILTTHCGFEIDISLAWQGIEQTTWPGRLWKVPGLRNVYMDGAHNLDGSKSLAQHICQLGIRPHLFFSAMGDKDIFAMRECLIKTNPVCITLASGMNSRYATVEQLRNVWGHKIDVLDIKQTIELLKKDSQDYRLVCGSLYFIGDLLAHFGIKL